MSKTLTVLGIDTGWEWIGAARITFNDGRFVADEAKVIRTKLDRRMNAADNEKRRGKEIWNGLEPMAIGCHAVAYELYNPWQGREQRTNKGSKVAISCGLAMAVGFSTGSPVIGVRPDEQKKAVTGSGRATKSQVQSTLCAQIEGLTVMLDNLKQAVHASDAAAVAYTGICRCLKVSS